MEKITLYRNNDGWMAIHSDPEVKQLFGTDTIPTAYTKKATKSMVLKKIQELNPGHIVTAWGNENI